MDLAGIQNPKPDIVEKFKDDVRTLREFTTVQYGQQYLLEKVSHICFVMVKEVGIIDAQLDSHNLLKLGCLILGEGFQKTLIFPFSCLIT